MYPDAYNKYQKATLLFEKKRDQEALNELQKIINDSTTSNRIITVTYQNEQKTPDEQSVSLQAAAYNMAGYILMNHNEKDKALFLLQKAIEISPDFKLAIGNMNNLKKIRRLMINVHETIQNKFKRNIDNIFKNIIIWRAII